MFTRGYPSFIKRGIYITIRETSHSSITSSHSVFDIWTPWVSLATPAVMALCQFYPLVYNKLWKIIMFNGKIHYKWPLLFTRGYKWCCHSINGVVTPLSMPARVRLTGKLGSGFGSRTRATRTSVLQSPTFEDLWAGPWGISICRIQKELVPCGQGSLLPETKGELQCKKLCPAPSKCSVTAWFFSHGTLATWRVAEVNLSVPQGRTAYSWSTCSAFIARSCSCKKQIFWMLFLRVMLRLRLRAPFWDVIHILHLRKKMQQQSCASISGHDCIPLASNEYPMKSHLDHSFTWCHQRSQWKTHPFFNVFPC